MNNSIEAVFNEFSRIDKRISSLNCFVVEAEWWQTLLFLITLKDECPDSLFAFPEALNNSKLQFPFFLSVEMEIT